MTTDGNPYDAQPWRQHYGAKAGSFCADPCLVSAYFDRNAQEFGSNIALSFGDVQYSFSEVDALASRLASGLSRQGIGKGDRVGYCMGNDPAFVILFLSLWKIGALGVGFNPLYPVSRLSHQADDCGVKAIVTSNEPVMLQKVLAVRDDADTALAVWTVSSGKFGSILGPTPADGARPIATIALADILDDERLLNGAALEAQTDLAALCYTGGTTGVPKGVQLTHANLAVNAQQMLSWFPDLKAGKDSLYAAGPFTHIAGVGPLLTFAAAGGLELVIQNRFDADEALDLIDKGRLSMLLLNPTMCIALLQKMEGRSIDWSKVKYVSCAAAPLTPDIRDRFFNETGKRIYNLFGMTETSPGLIQGLPEYDEYATAIGCPLPGTMIELRSTEDPAQRVGIGEVGEICAKGPQVMSGYWRQDDENRQFFTDGFFRTGDLAYMTAEGVFFLVDRLKNVIIASGYNVYPAQVEAVLSKHPAILEAAVVGVPDAYRGETVKACVVLRPGQELSLEKLKQDLGASLSPIEFPRLLDILPEMPKTANMKIARDLLV
jgi:long-chain acyl-CoA synthetase